MDVVAATWESRDSASTADSQGTEALRVFVRERRLPPDVRGPRRARPHARSTPMIVPGASPVVVISHHFWRKPAEQRSVELSARPSGSMARRSRSWALSRNALRRPCRSTARHSGRRSRAFRRRVSRWQFSPASRSYVDVIGRLRPGASLAGPNRAAGDSARGGAARSQPKRRSRYLPSDCTPRRRLRRRQGR